MPETKVGSSVISANKKNISWYFLTSIFTKGVVFFLVPVYTNYLSPEEFGLLATAESLTRIIPLFISFSLDMAFLRYYYEQQEKGLENISLLFSTYFFFVCIFGGSLLLVIAFLASFFDVLGVDFGLIPFVLLIITSYFTQLGLMVLLVWKAEVKAKNISYFNFSVSILSFIITVFLLLFSDIGWVSRLYAICITALIQMLVLLSIAIKCGWLSFTFSHKVLASGLKYSLPLLPGVVSFWIVGFSDRLILTYYDKADEVGIYSLAAQLVLMIYILQDAITQVNTPLVMKSLSKGDKNIRVKQAEFFIKITLIMGFIYFLLVTFSRELIFIISDSTYATASGLIFLLGLVHVFRGWYRVFSVIISYHKATWILSLAAVFQCLISITFNLLLIPYYGMYAAATSACLSVFLYFIWIIFWSQRIDPIPLNYFKIAKIVLLFSVLTCLSISIDSSTKVSYSVMLFKVIFFSLASFLVLRISGYFHTVLNAINKGTRYAR